MAITKQHLFVFFLGMLMCSLALSPFLLSVSMIALGVLALLDIQWIGKYPSFDLNRAGIRRLGHIREYPEFFALSLVFFVTLWGFWDLVEPGYFLERLRIKIPFLLFPLAFVALPKLTVREASGIFAFFLVVICLMAIWVLCNYALHFEEINTLLRQGQSMPTPRNHIRFSLLVAMAIFGGLWLVGQRYRWRYVWEPHGYIGMTIFLFIFIHILSVKTGLLALYVMLGVLGLRSLVRSRSVGRSAAILVAIIILPVIGYLTIPSLRNKIDYTIFDLRMYQKGEGGSYADAGRIISMRAGIRIAENHWLGGVGPGNLRAAMRSEMGAAFPEYKQDLMPHNQFIHVLAGAGLTGFLVFLIGFYYPLFHRRNFKFWPILAIYAMLITIFMIEATIENAAGTAFSLFFLLVFLSVFSKSPKFETKPDSRSANHIRSIL